MSHLGNPCIHCGVGHDDVASGPCASNIGITAIVREKAYYEALLAKHEKDAAATTKHLKALIAVCATDLARAESGLDLDKIKLAETVIFASKYAGGGDDRGKARQDAILWLSGAETIYAYKGNLSREYFGTKSYDRWYGQRCDCEYGLGPRHGSIIFRIGLTPDARKRELTPDEREAAVYYLTNLERIQAEKVSVA